MVVGRIDGVAALTGFSYKKMYERFAGTEKGRHNNEVTVRQGSTVRFSKLPSSSSFPSWPFSAPLSWRLFSQRWPVSFSLERLLQLLHARLLFQQP